MDAIDFAEININVSTRANDKHVAGSKVFKIVHVRREVWDDMGPGEKQELVNRYAMKMVKIDYEVT